jgi:hypothetical protein
MADKDLGKTLLSEEEEEYWITCAIEKTEEEVEAELAKVTPEKKAAINALIADIFFPK